MPRTNYGDAVRHGARYKESQVWSGGFEQIDVSLPDIDKQAVQAAAHDPIVFTMFVCTAAIIEAINRKP